MTKAKSNRGYWVQRYRDGSINIQLVADKDDETGLKFFPVTKRTITAENEAHAKACAYVDAL
jgi:hypothetical protein